MTSIPATDRPDVALGDHVETEHFGHRGRVYAVHPYGCPEDENWLARQAVDVSAYADQPWVSVLVHGGGSVAAPAALVRPVPPFAFDNASAHHYFRDARPV